MTTLVQYVAFLRFGVSPRGGPIKFISNQSQERGLEGAPKETRNHARKSDPEQQLVNLSEHASVRICKSLPKRNERNGAMLEDARGRRVAEHFQTLLEVFQRSASTHLVCRDTHFQPPERFILYPTSGTLPCCVFHFPIRMLWK